MRDKDIYFFIFILIISNPIIMIWACSVKERNAEWAKFKIENQCVFIGSSKGLKHSANGYKCKDGLEYWRDE